MYVRPQNYRYPEGMRLPENYSGNTFREPLEQEEAQEEPLEKEETLDEQALPTQGNDTKDSPALLPTSGFKLRINSLFGGNGKIGTEELLILALILLLADTENNDDLILFLVLLFFIK